jgi:hypothetical protein
MRLRAVLNGGRRLQEVLRALERVSKTVTVLLTPTEISLVANPNSPDSLQVWAVFAAVGCLCRACARACACASLCPPARLRVPACLRTPACTCLRARACLRAPAPAPPRRPPAQAAPYTAGVLRAQSGADGDGVFKTYRIESLNGNKIGFETDLAQFQRALKVPCPEQSHGSGACISCGDGLTPGCA